MGTNIKMLAKELNLSIATISRALHDSHEVSEVTKKKVNALAKKFNYQPNPYASSLRQQRSKTIAIIIPEIANNFFALAINGIEEIAQSKGYHVLIYLTHDSLQKEIAITKHLQSGRVDGILMSVSSETVNSDHIKELDHHIPVVFFDRVCDDIKTISKVSSDDLNGGYQATEHLIKNGCKKIAYLQLSKNLSIGKRRMEGYQKALKKHSLKVDPKLIVNCSNDEKENYIKIEKLLKSRNSPDGILASVEHLALTTYYVCKNINVVIPDDVKVISFCNLPTAPLLSPSLTTITQPAFQMGKEAMSILVQKLKKNNNTIRQDVVLESLLVVRQSSTSIQIHK